MAAVTSSSVAAKTSSSAVNCSEETLARRLWIKFSRECLFSMYSPFVVSLAAGNLKIETFRQYIAQDVHFLKAFAQAYELAEECADDDDDKLAISELRKRVLEELKMHTTYAQEWGLGTNEEVPVNSATLRYTEFLLATASGKVEGLKAPGMLDTPFEKTKVAAYTLSVVTPCMRFLACLGKEFGTFLHLNEGNHPYKKWISNYSSEAFQASTKQTEDLLEKLSVCMTGEELDIIEKLYQQSMKLEVDFLHAQPLSQPIIVPLVKGHNRENDHLMIFSDFDLTCTVVDSSAILAEIAIVTAPKSDQSQSEQQIQRMLSADLRNTWNLLSKQYTEEYEECVEKILTTEKAEKFDYEGLCKALEQLSDFEKMANVRVIESSVLKGLNLEDIQRAGERLILQDGCINFFQNIIKNETLNANIHVLSYCWCGDLIRAAFSAGGLDSLKVHANEFQFEESVSTGEIERKMESPNDKAQQFKKILESKSEDKKKLTTVYIGDSVGDLLCLLEADVGIVVSSSSSLRRVGRHFGISFVPLYSGILQKQRQEDTEEASASPVWTGLSGTLYTVSNWAEIHSFILGWQ